MAFSMSPGIAERPASDEQILGRPAGPRVEVTRDSSRPSREDPAPVYVHWLLSPCIHGIVAVCMATFPACSLACEWGFLCVKRIAFTIRWQDPWPSRRTQGGCDLGLIAASMDELSS